MNKKILSIIDLYGIFLLALGVSYNFFVYIGTRILFPNKEYFDLSLPIDSMIPFLPWTMSIYLICFGFWAVNYILAVRFDHAQARRFVLAHCIGETVCLLCFTLLPVTMERPVPDVTTFFGALCDLVYRMDPADNLLPSLHCYVSWLCWIGVRSNKKIWGWYKWFSLVFAIAVCISTLTVKQHLIVDVIAGVLVAEASYSLATVVQKAWVKRRAAKQKGCQAEE
jgi:membrane-associated phospholipid phosphatase